MGETDLRAVIEGDSRQYDDDESFARRGFKTQEFDDNEELVDIEEEEFDVEEDIEDFVEDSEK